MSIPKRNGRTWDGYYNYYTKNCPSCSYMKIIEGQYVCGWGTAFKYLSRQNGVLLENGELRKCGLLNWKIQPKKDERSVNYLDEIIKQKKI